MFYLTVIWRRTYGKGPYTFRLAANNPLYAPSHRQDSTHNGLCYTSCGALAGTRNSSMDPPTTLHTHLASYIQGVIIVCYCHHGIGQ